MQYRFLLYWCMKAQCFKIYYFFYTEVVHSGRSFILLVGKHDKGKSKKLTITVIKSLIRRLIHLNIIIVRTYLLKILFFGICSLECSGNEHKFLVRIIDRSAFGRLYVWKWKRVLCFLYYVSKCIKDRVGLENNKLEKLF